MEATCFGPHQKHDFPWINMFKSFTAFVSASKSNEIRYSVCHSLSYPYITLLFMCHWSCLLLHFLSQCFASERDSLAWYWRQQFVYPTCCKFLYEHQWQYSAYMDKW